MIAIRRRISTPFSALSGIPATVAEPEVGAINVPSVRTVVDFKRYFREGRPCPEMLGQLADGESRRINWWHSSRSTGRPLERTPPSAERNVPS